MRLVPLAVASAAALLLSPLPAFATGGARSLSVSHADLNLASVAGQRALDRRVAAAARRVCAVDPNPRPLEIAMIERRCMRDAFANAQPAVVAAVARTRSAPIDVASAR